MKRLGIITFALLIGFWVLPWRQTPIVMAQGRTLTHLLTKDSVLLPPEPLPQSSCISQAPAGTHGITTCWVASVSTTTTGYNIYVGSVTGGPYTKVNSTLITATSFFYPTPNLGGVKQFIVIRSFDGTAESVNSTEISATALGNPLPPTGVQAVAADSRWHTEPNI